MIVWSFAGLEDGTVLPGFGTILTALFWVIIMGAWMLRNPPSPIDVAEPRQAGTDR